ncbi:hypothetical protein P700755_001165 [Psychroflexus torquis ATCC 700755]|uniref:Uncharacterized protein n=1 Tax=Psychroflexus torquis (strain ATCC 700755 / CIP 106069 / ACAM 623) TaxID=313595 RepID=K4IGD0_PSYTT|nr:hypothetical protein [Psychroflexus torquis]AFU68121.1 hypothetical protein P700755_001165 [Psychroflexus torquis ATCC 700755]
MKKQILTILFVMIGFSVFSQNSTWLFDKKVKTVNFLGDGIDKYDRKNKELLTDPTSECNSIPVKIDTVQIKNSNITEFQYKSRDFFTKFFNTKSIRITDVKMYNPIEYTLDYNTVKNMPRNEYFVYSGQSADSLEFKFSFARKTEVDIDETLNTITSILTTTGLDMSMATEFIPLFDESRIESLDSLIYKYIIKDPNALFRVQVIKKKNTKFDPSGDDYRLYFPSLTSSKINIKDTQVLKFATPMAITQKEKPRFGWYKLGKTSNNAYNLKLDKEKNGELRLGVEFIDGTVKNTYFRPKMNGEKRYWQETILVNTFRTGRVRKLVYVSIFAEQISTDEVKVTNKITTNGIESKVSYMSYPEIKLKYLK